ncbi:MAG: TIGR01777 family oxidoreductase [Gaiellales bacterium]
MRVAITGASGLLGSALSAALEDDGCEVVGVPRGDTASLAGAYAVVHLAGEPIGQRWNEERKREIRRSRDEGTRTVAEALARLETPPAVLVSASAVGIYGSRGDEILTEESTHGADFLAEVCERWEAACDPARTAGVRVVNARFGVVLEAILPRLLTPFRLGLGGRVGSGKQWLSWIGCDDLVAAVRHALHDRSLIGPINVCAPEPVTNAMLTKTLGRVLERPTVFPLPTVLASAVFGEMGRSTLLASQRALPSRLLASGFAFAEPSLEGALRHSLARTS